MLINPENVSTLGEILMAIVWNTSMRMLLIVTFIGAVVYFLKPLAEWLKDLFGSGSNKT